MTNQKLNRRQARWTLYLSRFDFILKHIPENKMGKTDGLSRRLDWERDVGKKNKDKRLVKEEWLKRVQVEEVIIERVDILRKIKESRTKDNKVIKAVEEIKWAKVKVLRNKEWREKDRLLLKEGKVYVPKDEELRAEIIQLHYDIPVGGHRG